MKTAHSCLCFFGVVAFAMLANQVVVGANEAMTTTILDDNLGEGNVTVTVEADEVPVEAPVEVSGFPSPEPSFKQGDAPVVFQPGDIIQPVFESPVAPPPISDSGRVAGTTATLMAAATALAIVLAAVL